jgi:hypothetical protein
MARAQIQIRTKTWTPASATTDETAALFSVKKGERVLWASALPLVAATAGQVGTVSLGDGTAVAGYIAAFTVTQAASPVNTPIGGSGTMLAPSGGKLYTADDTVDVTFDYTSGGAIFPIVRFTIAVVREYPN